MMKRPVLFLTGILALSAFFCGPNALAQNSRKEVKVKAWPIAYYAEDKEANTEELEIAWPLIDYRKTTEKDPWSLLHFFSIKKHPRQEGKRVAAGFNLAGYASGGEDRWRFWTFPVLWFGATPNASHSVVAPILFLFKSSSSKTSAVFPLFYNNKGEKEANTGTLYLVWKGWRERQYSNDPKIHRSEYFRVIPFFWSSVAFHGEDLVRKMHSVFPLYFFSKYDNQDKNSGRKGYSASGLYFIWSGHRESVNTERQTESESDYLRVFPLYKQTRNNNRDDQNQTQTTRTLSRFFPIIPLFKYETKAELKEGGRKTTFKKSAWILPIFFWGERAEDNKVKESHNIVFPFWWDVVKEDGRIRAFVPLGAHIKDGDFSAFNILGPMFTRIENKEKDYARYDAFFPIFMLKKGASVSAARILPLFGYQNDFGKRRSSTYLWPFIRREESAGAASPSPWTALFNEFFQPFHRTTKATVSGELYRQFFPFFDEHRRAQERSWNIFPFGGDTYKRSGSRDTHTRTHGTSLLFRKTTATEPKQSSTSFLAGALNRTTGEQKNGWRFFPLASNYTDQSYSPYNGTSNQSNRQSYLWPIYSQSRSEQRLGWNNEISETRASQNIPILYSHAKTKWPKTDESSAGLEILDVPILPLTLYSSSRQRDGRADLKIFNPLYSRSENSVGEWKSKSFGGLVAKAEKDINGFYSRNILCRIFRTESNSRRSSWELMPLAYGERDARGGGKSLGFLFDSIAYRKTAESTRFRFLYIPIYNKKHEPKTLSEEQTIEEAKKHLEYGLKYLEGWHTERAFVELSLAEPAFGDDPALYEKLGDAYATAFGENPWNDLIEKSFNEISSFTSDYPAKYQVELAEDYDWRKIRDQKIISAYTRAIDLGGDVSLLRRKVIRYRSRHLPRDDRKNKRPKSINPEIDRLYITSLEKYPDDFSLQLDYATRLMGHLDDTQRGKDLLRVMLRNHPDSALLRYRIIQHMNRKKVPQGAYMAKYQEILEIALEGARLSSDEPAYIELYPQNNATPPQDYRNHCREQAVNTMEAILRVHMRDKNYTEALDFLTRLIDLQNLSPTTLADGGGERRRGQSASSYVGRAEEIFRKTNRLEELLPYVKEQAAKIRIAPERALWDREIRRLERDASYILHWGVQSDGVRTEIHNALYDTYVDLHKHFALAGKRNTAVSAILSVQIQSPKAQDAFLLLGFDERCSASLNGQPILKTKRRTIATIDEFKIPITLKKGKNTLTLTLENKHLATGLFARIADEKGLPVRDLKISPVQLNE